METKFTKGEWRVEGVVNGKGFDVTFNDDGEVIADYVYEEPDAHLIASAPEMYKALVQIQIEGGLSVARHKSITGLLAKARGEQ